MDYSCAVRDGCLQTAHKPGGSHIPLKTAAGCFAMSLKRLPRGAWVNRAAPLSSSGSARVTADLCRNASLSHLFPSSH